MKDETSDLNQKVIELRSLCQWSDAQLWCSPEQHGTITGLFKTLIDHIPLSTGSVRPTQGRCLAVGQVSGGAQSFNSVNQLRQLGKLVARRTLTGADGTIDSNRTMDADDYNSQPVLDSKSMDTVRCER
jgi:arsenic resistance protein ArsH